MPQIHLTKENISKELFNDVMFIVFSAQSAMGCGGKVHFIKQDGTEYFFNFSKDELSCSQVEEYFSPIQQFKRESIPFKEWHLVYLGIQTSIAIKDEVFDTFKLYAKDYPVKNYCLFQNWRKVVQLTLNNKDKD